MKTCPRCGKTGTVEEMFGYRNVRQTVVAQSWCTDCRGVPKLVPTMRARLERLYRQEYPNDKEPHRSAKFMANKIIGKYKRQQKRGRP